MYGILTSGMLEYICYGRVLLDGLGSRCDTIVLKSWVKSEDGDSLYGRSKDWWRLNGWITTLRFLLAFPSSSPPLPRGIALDFGSNVGSE
jgi:hypothetical protein